MGILGRSSAVARSANVRNILCFLVGICGIFQLVHGRHREVENVPYESVLKYDSQLSSAEKSVNDGELLFPQIIIIFHFSLKKNRDHNEQRPIFFRLYI